MFTQHLLFFIHLFSFLLSLEYSHILQFHFLSCLLLLTHYVHSCYFLLLQMFCLHVCIFVCLFVCLFFLTTTVCFLFTLICVFSFSLLYSSVLHATLLLFFRLFCFLSSIFCSSASIYVFYNSHPVAFSCLLFPFNKVSIEG